MSGDLLAGVQAFAAIAAILFVGAFGVVLLRGLSQWIDRRTAVSGGGFDELNVRVAELEAERGRVAELEERLEFAERLLAERERVPERLGGGA